jgi:hypothetical protein
MLHYWTQYQEWVSYHGKFELITFCREGRASDVGFAPIAY